MKKLFLTAILSLVLLSSIFSITALEKLLLPEFKGDLSKVEYKIVEYSDDVMVIIVDGVAYILKLK
jgi:hypothetical protein